MNRKNKIDKSLFDFAFDINSSNEISIKHLEKAYRLDSDVCKSKANKNCVNNVRCLNGLGEKSWLSQTDEQLLEDNEDSRLGRRAAQSFVGLKNLGATCYVNCLLQVWFHNPVLRQTIYNWRPEEDPEEISFQTNAIQLTNSCEPNANSNSENETNNNLPISCIGKLQLIFALMQFGIRSTVDPKPIIKCLELNESQQQDAHEFSNLFFTLIEHKLKYQKSANIQLTIQNQYCGRFAYITRCQTCSDGSQRESQFYELDLNIKGCKDIYESLFEYLKEEHLEGNNQYYCGNCKSKQNAKRFIELRKLPPVLNLQLLRFVFDPQLSKRKLNSFIRFPDNLDLKPYLSSDMSFTAEETTYHLSAVLIHRGKSAHSGHYIAHIKDANTGFWYKFNDEKVEEIEGQKLKLDSDEGTDEVLIVNDELVSKVEKPKDKGWHQSNNAYMLVYRNQTQQPLNLANTYQDWNLPQYLINAIEDDKKIFEESIAMQQLQRDFDLNECKKHRSEVKSIFENLVALPDQPFEIISKKWLANWLTCRSSDAISPVDNSGLLCPHSNLNFKCLSSFKCISTTGADQIYKIYGGGPRLNKDSLCRTCVAKQVCITKLTAKIDEDIKLITSQLKFTLEPNEEAFWVGKDSLRTWKKIKISTLENCFDENGESNHESKDFDQDSDIINFNSDIYCKHGDLIPDESERRLVSANVWRVLKTHFPEAQDFEKEYAVCSKCVLLNAELESVKTSYKEMAQNQKSILPNLSNERKRLTWDELSPQLSYFGLSRKFLNDWKKFINDPTRYDPPESIENSGLICAHQKFLYPTDETQIMGIDSKFVIISKEEWQSLATFYSHDFQISFHVVLDECNENKFIESNPTYCNSCNRSLELQKERDRLTYNNQYIYVRKMETNESHSDSNVEKQDESSQTYESIPKKSKKEDTKHVYGNGDNQGLRRSSRRRKNKNEKEIKVSSTDTLLDLKVQIMNIFKVPTFDQHLSVDDRPLMCNNQTLAQLRVEPHCIITLKVDEEPTGDCVLIDDYIKGSAPEIGFKGTQLQHH